MAPRSPTQAFDPTPALEHNANDYSPLNDPVAMLAIERPFPHASREVRFSNPPANPLPRAHSIATDQVPLLPQVSSASQLPRQAFRINNPAPGIDINAYIENCRNLNEQLRVAHDSERKAWEIERTALRAKIADLEFQLNKSSDVTKRYVIDRPDPHAVRPSTRSHSVASEHPTQEPAPLSSLSSPLVWKGSDSQPLTARVFPNEDVNGNHLPSISEDDQFPSLSKEISPMNSVPPVESVPIPIEKVEPTLDGITLKSAGLTSSFVTKITSPQFGSPALEPLVKAKTEPTVLRIDANSLMAPLDEKLRRHAGHTPMNFEGVQISNETSNQPSNQLSPLTEKPIAPAPTKRPPLRPSENSDSYFSVTSDMDVNENNKRPETIPEEATEEPQFEPEDDKPLKGPLTLDPSARTEAADVFLSSVDAKLMAAVREASPKRRESVLSENGEAVTLPIAADQAALSKAQDLSPEKPKVQDDDMPKLRLKKSMNFGSAYGASRPGHW